MELAALGIDAEAERAYRFLIDHGEAAAPEVAADLGCSHPTAVAELERLVAFGLVAVDGERYRAGPPELALRSLLMGRRSELSRAEAALADLAERFRSQSGRRSVREVVEVVSGAEAIRNRFMQIQRAAERTVRAFVKAEPSVVSSAENDAEDEAVERGVAYQVVVERAMLDRPGMIGHIRDSMRAGERVRATESVPLRMVMADDSAALVPLGSTDRPGALIVHQSGLLEALEALFEMTWEQSEELFAETGAPGEDEDTLDEQILALLGQGFGDKAVARNLDVSPRTVQRRLRHLMDQAGASTRFQLGLWLGRTRP
ncbi:helix-turn-helix transcriptional regulator [Glycomyces salinus]|uniref:helix-turn-helix transcriptional regulator n=1 Tax=Glycomyces salinus TaxID=980294 RepID=UPI0018ECC651|nr:helix-turn-helix transcriptional regulator [Glycomyces salinus]